MAVHGRVAGEVRSARVVEVPSPGSEAGQDEARVVRAQSGDQAALDGLLRQFRGVALTRSRAYFVAGADREDVFQEAMVGLYKAVRDFRLERGVPFRAFARLCIDRQVLTAVRSSSRLKHRHLNRAVSLFSLTRARQDGGVGDDDPPLPSSGDFDPLENVLATERYEELRDAIPGLLSARETEVLKLVMAGHGYLAIAGMLACAPKSVDNTLQRIRRKVRAFLDDRGGADDGPPSFAEAR